MLKDQQQNQQPVVLVVDDDIAVRLLMRESLEQAGLTVKEAENGVEALSAFQQVKPKLVLLDVNMPGMDGFAACSRLRALPGGDDVAIVIVTGLGDVKSIRLAYEAGATDFITKPVNWPILNHRVRYLLRAIDAFRALRQSEARLSQAQRVAHLGNWERDIFSNKLYWSDEIYHIFGLEPQTFGATYEAFLRSVHPEDRTYVNNAVNRALHEDKLYGIDYRIILPDGTERSVHEQGQVVFDETGKSIGIHGIVQDITKRKMDEAKIRSLAYYDVLTGLPNRQLFKEHADRAIRIARRDGTKVIIIFLDLDNFKRINDTLGHNAGDNLLKKISENLKTDIRTSDIVARREAEKQFMTSLSRLGGDEFTILLTGLVEVEHVARVAKRIIQHISLPVKIDGQELYITGSAGIAVYPEDGEDIDTLLKNADAAMYYAKEAGRNNFQFYAKHMNARTLVRLNMEAKLKKALEQNELVLYYQPQVEMQTDRIVGLEALIRWEHPEMGLVSPAEFIPIAEETGLIIPIGEWVLKTACAQIMVWHMAGFIPLSIGVNLSGRQFRERNLVKSVKQILDTTRLDPKHLGLELTESIIMHDVEETITALYELKEIGLNLSVDDFGTGYSSMSYLKRFPLDTLKIDRSFVKDITTDPNDAAITKATIALAKSLDLTTIAEGVETEEQLTFLREQGCDQIQGYLISRPVPAEKVEEFLLRYNTSCKDICLLQQKSTC
ncbi:MAG: EAL domain-containing protein [Deltaproteobacteria bacterium]|nr:EAL domain-containing protein [Deltaproteobacteria bacterium]MBW1931791.1 EAL domain-containing protein [Deltaproteobacteria bacterium]MBW1937899.1 EAL domain-containing protein [Deltaproteobacteria bacterium]MBW2079455.1 EAL domain-containing protein [Deltaproteobacteria bacterium]